MRNSFTFVNMKEEQNSAKTWLKRVGIAGFLFFLIKGLGWLAFIYFGASWFKGCGM
jgi:hypothetical protein